jgi:hypothetical protein
LRVVTIEGFGCLTAESTGSPGFIYEGGAWLLRFTTQSADHFFKAELAHLCEVLGIDERQIYEITLYGRGRGLFDVRLSISFTKPPLKRQVDQLKYAVSSVESYNHEGDALDYRFTQLLRSAKPAMKRRFAEAVKKETRNVFKKTTTP